MKDQPTSNSSTLAIVLVVAAVLVLVIGTVGSVVLISRGDADERNVEAQVDPQGDDDGSGEESGDGSDEGSDASGSGSSGSPVSADEQVFRSEGQDRWLEIRVPKEITSFTLSRITVEGATGKAASGFAASGGFIVTVFAVPSAEGCAAQPDDAREATPLVSSNIFIAGPFRTSGAPLYSRDGAFRVCGYLSRPGDANKADLLVDEPIDVIDNDEIPQELPEVETRTGTYTAAAGDIVGGTGGSSISLTLTGDPTAPKLSKVDVKGLRYSTCPSVEDDSRRGTTAAAVLTKEGPTPNEFIGDHITSYFEVGEYAQATVVGGSDGRGEIRGVVVLPTKDGQCSGSFAFTAKRDG